MRLPYQTRSIAWSTASSADRSCFNSQIGDVCLEKRLLSGVPGIWTPVGRAMVNVTLSESRSVSADFSE